MASFLKKGFSKLSSSVVSQRFTTLRKCSSGFNSSQCSSMRSSSLLCSNKISLNIPVKAYSSDADREFLNVLTEEVRLEKEQMYDIPSFSGGWKVSRDGPDCKLSKDMRGDSVQISFNVNSSVPPLETEDPNDTDEVRAEPDFMVDVKKSGTSDILTFECFFPSDEQESSYDERESNYCIRSLTMHTGKITESTYSMETEHLDTGLYDNLMNFLNARGIDNIFADELVQYATAVENNCYIQALERLGNFIRK